MSCHKIGTLHAAKDDSVWGLHKDRDATWTELRCASLKTCKMENHNFLYRSSIIAA